MLGNFSFGDYFKDAAIEHAWTLLTREWVLPKDKLTVTVYHTDDEAHSLWKTHCRPCLTTRIIRIATSDNFLVDGRYRPVRAVFGNSSMITAITSSAALPVAPDEEATVFVEIWNLVFMAQYESQGRWHPSRPAQSPRSTPAWESNASPRCCRVCTTITIPTPSRR